MFEPTKISGLRRGMMAREIAGGREGIIGAICLMMNGSVMVEIRPSAKEGEAEPPKSIWVDEKAAVMVAEHMVEKFTYADQLLPHRNGDVIEDIVSGLRGTITQMSLWLNGCVTCEVTPRTDYATNSPQPVWLDQHRLKSAGETRNPPTLNPKGGAPEMRGDRGRHV